MYYTANYTLISFADAEARFEDAMKGKKFGLRFTTILFTGLPGSDVHACKRMIMDKNFTPFESPHSLDPIQSGAPNIEFSYYTLSGESFKPLQDEDLDIVFACNAAKKAPKGAKNDKSDESSTQQGPQKDSSENPQMNPSNENKNEKDKESFKDTEEPNGSKDLPPQRSTSNLILAYEPIPKESLLKCVSSENILELMINCDQSLITDLIAYAALMFGCWRYYRFSLKASP